MATNKQTAILVVDKDWMNTGVRLLANEGKPSLSSETHLLIGPLEDAVDPHGVLLSGITSHQLTEDGSPITMKLLVPWSAILALGIVEDENAKVKHGYTTHEKSHTLGKGTAS